jgi:hypothetical protein
MIQSNTFNYLGFIDLKAKHLLQYVNYEKNLEFVLELVR